MAVDGGQIYIDIDARIDNFNRRMYQVDNELGKLKRQSAIAIPVDTKQLHGLNDLIDKKIKHIGELRKEASIPIKSLYDPTSLSAGINQVREFRRELGVLKNDMMAGGSFSGTIRHQISVDSLRQDSLLASEIRGLGKQLDQDFRDVIKEVAHLRPGGVLSKIAGFAFDVVSAPIRIPMNIAGQAVNKIATGFAEEIGRTLAGEFATSGVRESSAKVKAGVRAFNNFVVGTDNYFETFLGELLDTGDFKKATEAAKPRSGIAKSLERIYKLRDIATQANAAAIDQIIQSDNELKKIYATIENRPLASMGTTSKLQTLDKFLDLAQPKGIVDNVINPIIAEFQPLLKLIQGIQTYRTSKQAQQLYDQIKGNFPDLQNYSGAVSVGGGGQFAGGQGGRQIAMALEPFAPNVRFIPVENPNSDAPLPGEKRPAEELIKKGLSTILPDLMGDKDVANTVMNVARQALFAINPMATSIAATQALANTLAANSQGKEGRFVGYSMSGGMDAMSYARTAQYMGLQTNTLAMSYPTLGLSGVIPQNYQSAILKGDPLTFGNRLGLGRGFNAPGASFLNTIGLSGTDAHDWKHLFKEPAFPPIFYNAIGSERPTGLNRKTEAGIAESTGNLYELIGIGEQLKSLMKTGEFDLNSPFKGFKTSQSAGGNFDVESLITRFFEHGAATVTLTRTGGKALHDLINQYFKEIEVELAKRLSDVGVKMPENPSDLGGYLKYQEEAKQTNQDLAAFKSGDSSLAGYFARDLNPEAVKGLNRQLSHETIKWFKEKGSQFGIYQDQIVKMYEYLQSVMDEFVANKGNLSEETKANIPIFPTDEFSLSGIFQSQGVGATRINTLGLPSDESIRNPSDPSLLVRMIGELPNLSRTVTEKANNPVESQTPATENNNPVESAFTNTSESNLSGAEKYLEMLYRELAAFHRDMVGRGGNPSEVNPPGVNDQQPANDISPAGALASPEVSLFNKMMRSLGTIASQHYGVAKGIEKYAFDTVQVVSLGLVNLQAAKKVTQAISPAIALGMAGHDLPLLGAGMDAISSGVVTPLLSHGIGAVGSGIAGLLPEGLTSGAATAASWLSRIPGMGALGSGIGDAGTAALGGAGTILTYLLSGRTASGVGQFALNQVAKPLALLPSAVEDKTYNLLTGIGNFGNKAITSLPRLMPRPVEHVYAELLAKETNALPPATTVLSPLPPSRGDAYALAPAREDSPEVKLKQLIDSLKTNRKNINDQIRIINDIIDVERISSIANYSKNFIAEKQSLGGLPDQALSSKGSLVSTNKILGGWKGQFDQFVDPKDILKKAHGMGVAIPDGILLALQERGHLPKDATIEMLREMITSSKKTLKSNSPSLVFKEIGQDIVAGLDQGLDFSQVAQKVPKEMAAIIGDIESIVKRELAQSKQFGHNFADNLAETLETYYEWGGGNKAALDSIKQRTVTKQPIQKNESAINIPTEQELYDHKWEFKTIPGIKTLGEGLYGTVYDMGGYALKHGQITDKEIELSRRAGELGLGPRVLGSKRYSSSDAAIAMELIRGQTANDAYNISDGGKYPESFFKEVIRLKKSLIENGIAHNDLHGGNILIDKQGQLRAIDYGLAEDANVSSIVKDFNHSSFQRRVVNKTEDSPAKQAFLEAESMLPNASDTDTLPFDSVRKNILSYLDKIIATGKKASLDINKKLSIESSMPRIELTTKDSQIQPPEVGTRFTRSAVVEGQKLDLHAYVSKTMGWYLSDLMVNGDFKPTKDPAIRAALRKQLDLWMQELFSVVGSNTIRTSPIDARSERLWAGYGFKEMEGDENYGKMERVGLNINKGLTAGITGSEGEPIAAIANTSKKLITTAMDVLGEKSPSKVFIKIGENLVLGYKIGIDGAIQSIEMLDLPVPQLEKEGWKNIENYKEEALGLKNLYLRDIKNINIGRDINSTGYKRAVSFIYEKELNAVVAQDRVSNLLPLPPLSEAQTPARGIVPPPLPPNNRVIASQSPPLHGDDVWGDALQLWVSEIQQQQTSATRPVRDSTPLTGQAWQIAEANRIMAAGLYNHVPVGGGNGQPPRKPPIPPAGASPNPVPPRRGLTVDDLAPRRMGDNAKDFINSRANNMVAGIAQAPQNADKGFWEWFNNILDEIEAGAGAAGAGIRGLGRIMGALEEKMPGLARIIENIKGFAGGLLMYMGFQQVEQVLVDFARTGIDTALQLERMKAALTYDSSINAASKLKEIAQYADEIGANALVAAQSFTKLTVAAANTTVAPQVQEIFEGFSAALVGQGATPDEQQRAFLSVVQMIGKGEIMAEELRSQLAEVLPQAIGAMARSQGLTHEQLTNQMKNSKMFPETDLQPLAKQLAYEATLPINTVKEGPLGSIARFQNAQEKLQGRMGETILGVGKPAMDIAVGGMNALNSVATGLTASLGLLVTMLGAKFVFALLDTGTASRVVTIALKVLGLEFMTNNWILNGLNTGLAKLNTNLVISGSSSNVAVRGLAATAGALSGIGSALYAIAPQLIAFAAIGFAIDKGTKIWQSYHGELKKTNDELEQMINNLEATNTLTGKMKDPNKVDRNDPTYTRLGGSNPTPITGVGDFAQRVFGGVLNNYTHPFGFDPSAPNSGINNIVIDYRDEKGNIYKSVRMDKDDRRDLMEDLKQVDRGISYGKRLIEQADANYANPQNLAKGKADISQLDREIAVIRTRLANNSKLGGNNREEFKNLSAELAVKVGDREKAVNETFGNQIALEQMNKAYEAMRETVKKNPDAQAREAKLEVIAKLMSDTNVRLEAIRMHTGSINQKIPGLQGASQLVSSAGANIAEYNQGLASRRNNQLLEARLNQKLDDIDLQRQQALDNLTTAKRELLPVKQDAETFKGFALNGLEPSVAQDAMNRLELRGRGGEKYKDPLDMIMNTSVETMKALVESGDGISGGLKTFLEQSIKFKEKYQQANELEGKVLQAQIDLEKLQQQRLNAIRQANTQIAASNTNIEMYQAASKGKIGTQDIQAFSAYNDLATAKRQLRDVKALFKDNSQDPVELAKQLASANEAVAKAEFAVMQSGQNTEEYYRGLGQSVEDFNRSVLETEIGWQQQVRDFGWSVQDSARNAFIETRGLQEAWADLQFDLEGQLLAAQNELKSTSEKLRQAKATLAVESISFQPDSIGKKTASIFVDFLANIGNLEGEGRSLDEKQRQVGQEYVTTLRRIRDEQEKQLRAEEERTRSIIRLNEQFRSMMMQMESSSIKLGRELEQIITRITKEAPNSGYQNKLPSLPAAPLSYNPSAGINIDPRYGESVVERVPFSVPIGQPSAVVQPTKYYAPGDVNGLNGLMGKYGGGMRLNLAAPKQVKTSYQLQVPAQNILTAPAQAATTQSMGWEKNLARLLNQYGSQMTVEDFKNAATKSGVSIDALVTQAFIESHFGTKGRGKFTKNPLNYGNDDAGNNKHFKTYGQGLEYAAIKLKKDFFFSTPEDFINRDFKGRYGRYATDPAYGSKYLKSLSRVRGILYNQMRSAAPKEWLVADASEGISDMGSAIFQTNATTAARAKRIEQEKARKRQAELNDPNNISRKPLEDIIKYQKELYPEAFKLDEFYESKGIKFIDRMSSKDWKKRTEAIAKQFKESQARVDAAKGIGSSNANVNPNIKKYQTLPGYQPSQLEPQVDMNGGNVLPNVQSPFITKYQPRAINDYSGLQQITDQNPITVQDTSSLTNTAGQINDVKNATIGVNRAVLDLQGNLEVVKFNNAFQQQLQSLQDMALNLSRKVEDNNIKYRELAINSKGYKTAADEINLAVEGVSVQFRQMNRDFDDELRNLGRQMDDAYIGAAVAAQALADKQAELTKAGRQATTQELQAMSVYQSNLKLYTDSIPIMQARREEIDRQSKAMAALEEPTKRATEAWLRLDKIMASKQGYAKIQADLYKTRYDVGAQNDWGMGTLIDPSAIINARMQAAQARVDLEKQIRDGAYSPQQASEMRRFQAEISELNIKRSFVDAIPGLKEFSSGLRSAILESKGLGESLNKVKDLVLGMMLEQLAIKPFQNAIAEWVGPMLGLDNKEFYPHVITRLGERGASIAANNIVPFDLSNTLTTGQALPDTIDLSSAFTSLTESTTNTSQAMDNIFLAGITSTDPAMAGFILGLTEATTALSAFAGALTVSGGGSFINAGSDIFGNLFNAGNASAGQSIADSLSGGFTGMISHAFNFADGGPVDPLKIDNYAGGGLVEGISQAMNRERSQSGGKRPILAVLNADEYVISANEASDYRNYKDWSERMAKDVKNFAKGGPVSYIPNTTQTNTSEGTVNNFNQTIKIEVANTNDLGKSMSQIERDRQLAKLRAGVR
jgi:tape measure domain-containing protein